MSLFFSSGKFVGVLYAFGTTRVVTALGGVELGTLLTLEELMPKFYEGRRREKNYLIRAAICIAATIVILQVYALL